MLLALAVSAATYWLLLTLPAWGMALVLVVARKLQGPARRMTLAIAPLLVGAAMWWVGPLLYPSDDWLVRLFTLAVRGVSWLALLAYYATFLVAAIGGWLRHNAKLRSNAREATPGGTPAPSR